MNSASYNTTGNMATVRPPISLNKHLLFPTYGRPRATVDNMG